VVRTDSGVNLRLSADRVAEVILQALSELKYQAVAPRFCDTADDQWKLAEWYPENLLVSQRIVHLKRVIELDTDQAGQYIVSIRNPLAVDAMRGMLIRERFHRVKYLYLQTLSSIDNQAAHQALITTSLKDSHEKI